MPNNLKDVLTELLPKLSDKDLTIVSDKINDYFAQVLGFKLQWKTKVIEVLDPKDKDKPVDQQKLLFKCQILAGDFADETTVIKNFHIEFGPKE